MIAGNGTSVVFTMLNLVPSGFSMYLIMQLVICHITNTKDDKLTANATSERIVSLLTFMFFMLLFILVKAEQTKLTNLLLNWEHFILLR